MNYNGNRKIPGALKLLPIAEDKIAPRIARPLTTLTKDVVSLLNHKAKHFTGLLQFKTFSFLPCNVYREYIIIDVYIFFTLPVALLRITPEAKI